MTKNKAWAESQQDDIDKPKGFSVCFESRLHDVASMNEHHAGSVVGDLASQRHLKKPKPGQTLIAQSVFVPWKVLADVGVSPDTGIRASIKINGYTCNVAMS